MGNRSHTPIGLYALPNGQKLVELQQEETLRVFSDETDNGYHAYGTQWWTNPDCPHAFKYLALDALYAPTYFDHGRGHPSYDQAQMLYNYMQQSYTSLFGAPFASILELGTGGGEITTHFQEARLDLMAVEGTTAGVEKLVSLGIPQHQIIKANLKFMEPLKRRFDMAMCTEVAEHIEPWFASKIVSNCVEHADVIWFSAAKGTARPHYHHINEVPINAWDNIFAHFGYNFYMPLNNMLERADRIYMNAEAVRRIKT